MIRSHLIKNLAIKVAGDNKKVDSKIANFILNSLTKKEMKLFIRKLKKINSEMNVVVKFEGNLSTGVKKDIENMYKGKKVSYEKDKSLGGGIMIIDNDMIVNYNIKDMIGNKINII